MPNIIIYRTTYDHEGELYHVRVIQVQADYCDVHWSLYPDEPNTWSEVNDDLAYAGILMEAMLFFKKKADRLGGHW